MTRSMIGFIEAKFGAVPRELRKTITQLSTAKANRLIAHLPRCETLQDVEAWLAGGDRNGKG